MANNSQSGVSAASVLGAITLGALLLLGATLLVQHVIWNLGVDGLAEAVQANVSEIDFGTAFGAVFVLSLIQQLITGKPGISANINRG